MAEVGKGERIGNSNPCFQWFQRLFPISPLSTALLPKISLPRLGSEVHGLQVIGADVPVSPDSRQRQDGRERGRRTDLRRQAIEKSFGSFRGQPGRGAGRGDRLSRDAVPRVLRSPGEQSGTQERFPQEGPRNIGWLWPGDVGSRVQVERPGFGKSGSQRTGRTAKDKRTFGRRSRVEVRAPLRRERFDGKRRLSW